MLELILILVPIIAADAINPVLAAAVIFALGTQKPYRGAFWVLVGWFVVYFVAGLGLAIGLERITGFLANPRPIDFVIQIPIALGLIWFGYKVAREKENPRASQQIPQPTGSSHTLGPVAGFTLGATINVVGLPFAIPYFAAIDQILKVDLTASQAVSMLALYNALYILPFAALGLLRWMYRDTAAALFERVNARMEKVSAVVMPILLFLIGAVLLVDAVMFFTTGNPLINITPRG